MGSNLLWTGLFMVVALPEFGVSGVFRLVGAVLMAIGVVLLWIGR